MYNYYLLTVLYTKHRASGFGSGCFLSRGPILEFYSVVIRHSDVSEEHTAPLISVTDLLWVDAKVIRWKKHVIM